MSSEVQYISDDTGNVTGVIVPIDLWKKLNPVDETAYLLQSETMRTRLLEAKNRQEGIPYKEVREKLGI